LAEAGCLIGIDEMWIDWERWLIELGEKHTSEPSLNFLRSPRSDRSWLTAAAAILDAAIFRNAVLALPFSVHAETTYRAGVEAMEEIGRFFAIEPDPNEPGVSSVTRAEFDEALDLLVAAGAPVVDDRQGAWRVFNERRLAYEPQLLGLCGLILPPRALWTSDRGRPYRTPRKFRRKRH
jgi:hypothetical protein